MSLDLSSRGKFNLSNANILLVKGNQMGMDILAQILVGFGARELRKATSMSEAKALLDTTSPDLIICGAKLTDGDGCALISWLRRSGPPRASRLSS